MSIAQTDAPTPRKPLRLWPGVVIAILQCLVQFVVPVVAPEAAFLAMLGGLAGGLAVVVWWLFFSRAPWSERLGAVALMIAAMFATWFLLDESIAKGAMGMLFPILAIPILSLAFVAWAVATRRLPDGPRRATMAATILLACGGWTLLRTGGFTGDGDNDFAWRWSETRRGAAPGPGPRRADGGSRPAAAKTPGARPTAPASAEPAAPACGP